MGDQETLFVWILASGGFGAVLGGGFGATVGAVAWLNGHSAGTFLGFGMARAFERAAERKLTRGEKGALIGGTDGAAFLGVVGAVVGAIVASHSPTAWDVLGPAAAAAMLLVGGGMLFGALAYLLLRAGVRAVMPVFFGTMLGGAAGLFLGRINGLFTGLVVGLLAGSLLALLWRPPRP